MDADGLCYRSGHPYAARSGPLTERLNDLLFVPVAVVILPAVMVGFDAVGSRYLFDGTVVRLVARYS